MVEGGTIQRNKVKGMEDGMEEEVEASMEEFVQMISAGLAGSNPHMISATITSLSRLIFEFHSEFVVSSPPSIPRLVISSGLLLIFSFR